MRVVFWWGLKQAAWERVVSAFCFLFLFYYYYYFLFWVLGFNFEGGNLKRFFCVEEGFCRKWPNFFCMRKRVAGIKDHICPQMNRPKKKKAQLFKNKNKRTQHSENFQTYLSNPTTTYYIYEFIILIIEIYLF